MSVKLPFWSNEELVSFLSSFPVAEVTLQRAEEILRDYKNITMQHLLNKIGLNGEELSEEICKDWQNISNKMLTPQFVLAQRQRALTALQEQRGRYKEPSLPNVGKELPKLSPRSLYRSEREAKEVSTETGAATARSSSAITSHITNTKNNTISSINNDEKRDDSKDRDKMKGTDAKSSTTSRSRVNKSDSNHQVNKIDTHINTINPNMINEDNDEDKKGSQRDDVNITEVFDDEEAEIERLMNSANFDMEGLDKQPALVVRQAESRESRGRREIKRQDKEGERATEGEKKKDDSLVGDRSMTLLLDEDDDEDVWNDNILEFRVMDNKTDRSNIYSSNNKDKQSQCTAIGETREPKRGEARKEGVEEEEGGNHDHYDSHAHNNNNNQPVYSSNTGSADYFYHINHNPPVHSNNPTSQSNNSSAGEMGELKKLMESMREEIDRLKREVQNNAQAQQSQQQPLPPLSPSPSSTLSSSPSKQREKKGERAEEGNVPSLSPSAHTGTEEREKVLLKLLRESIEREERGLRERERMRKRVGDLVNSFSRIIKQLHNSFPKTGRERKKLEEERKIFSSIVEKIREEEVDSLLTVPRVPLLPPSLHHPAPLPGPQLLSPIIVKTGKLSKTEEREDSGSFLPLFHFNPPTYPSYQPPLDPPPNHQPPSYEEVCTYIDDNVTQLYAFLSSRYREKTPPLPHSSPSLAPSLTPTAPPSSPPSRRSRPYSAGWREGQQAVHRREGRRSRPHSSHGSNNDGMRGGRRVYEGEGEVTQALLNMQRLS